MIDISELRQSLGAVQPEEVSELLDRLEAAERERDALRAKIEAMERQEPVAEWIENKFDQYPQLIWGEKYKAVVGTKLYVLPGAKGEQT